MDTDYAADQTTDPDFERAQALARHVVMDQLYEPPPLRLESVPWEVGSLVTLPHAFQFVHLSRPNDKETIFTDGVHGCTSKAYARIEKRSTVKVLDIEIEEFPFSDDEEVLYDDSTTVGEWMEEEDLIEGKDLMEEDVTNTKFIDIFNRHVDIDSFPSHLRNRLMKAVNAACQEYVPLPEELRKDGIFYTAPTHKDEDDDDEEPDNNKAVIDADVEEMLSGYLFPGNGADIPILPRGRTMKGYSHATFPRFRRVRVVMKHPHLYFARVIVTNPVIPKDICEDSISKSPDYKGGYICEENVEGFIFLGTGHPSPDVKFHWTIMGAPATEDEVYAYRNFPQ